MYCNVVRLSLIVVVVRIVVYAVKRTTVDIKNRPRIPIPDEDPYSIAGANMVAATREQLMMQTATRRGDKPPKLPPRDPSNPYPHEIPKVIDQQYNIIILTATRSSIRIEVLQFKSVDCLIKLLE